MSRIGYAQIGTGHGHAAGKMATFRQSDEYEVLGIAEPDPDLQSRLESVEAYRDVPRLTVEQILNDDRVQIVGVETTIRDLLDNAEKCIAAGKHIHLDKPAGASLPHFRRILDDAARQHLAVQMGYMYRYHPGIVLIRKFLKLGWLGEPFELHCVMSKLADLRLRQELLPYREGTMLELGCHLIDSVVAILGVPDEVHAFPRHSADEDDGLIDNSLAVFGYPRATATIRTTYTEVDGGARRHFCICGTEGTVHLQPLDSPKVARVTFSQPHGAYSRGYQDVELPEYTRYVDDVADLAKIIRHEKDADYSYEHDYQVQRAVLLAGGRTEAELR
jgi:predicted dehydrogenase